MTNNNGIVSSTSNSSAFRQRNTKATRGRSRVAAEIAPAEKNGYASTETLLPLTVPVGICSNGSDNFDPYNAYKKDVDSKSWVTLFPRRRQRQNPLPPGCSFCFRRGKRSLVVTIVQSVLLFSGCVVCLLAVASLYVPRRQLLDVKLYLDQFWFAMENSGWLRTTRVVGFQSADFYLKQYPELALLEENWKTIQQEWFQIIKPNHDHDEESAAKFNNTHNISQVIPPALLRIPSAAKVAGFKKKAFQYSNTKWRSLGLKLGIIIEENRYLAPQTVHLIEQIPYIRTASFSILEPHTYIPPHWGYWKGYVRYQLAVQVPKVKDSLGQEQTHPDLWIRMVPGRYKTPELSDAINHNDFSLMTKGISNISSANNKYVLPTQTYSWTEGQGLMFDDTSVHDVKNGSDEIRVVLYLDLERKLPWPWSWINQIFLWFILHSPQIRRMQQISPFQKEAGKVAVV
ncbi:hypothetical protein ACA910_006991 [Epithemia clementina (nom. ined.)]